ncbi:hypothetical protein HXX76_012388 [Chlamydomonas incerta]|uniref:Uncharacterized protein n=1 Tax=Chlamydomonas incerta TaxID=51695 RepID=A0A835VSC8_CHLIN|nr:hypothetical protein HXX76_012388 [Chlamydomonas incerta]|eukprot:KAG2427452.1 hypothetical protein HXX76_012388 [Chlamydomonas incerta]
MLRFKMQQGRDGRSGHGLGASFSSAASGTNRNGSVGDTEDGFVIRGVHKGEELDKQGSQARPPSFAADAPAPVYRHRPRPSHITKETLEAKQRAEVKRTQAANKFRTAAQLARLAAHSKLAGQRGLGTSVANQVVAKKWKEVGNLLKKTAGGVSRIRALVEKDKRSYLAAANEALRLAAVGVLDVKLTVRSEKELEHLSYLRQGDASLYTTEALNARMAVKSQTDFRECVREWWKWLPLVTLPLDQRITDDEKLMPTDMRGMTKPVYCAMAQIIQRALLPRFGLKPNPAYEPEEDWAFDCKGRRFLLFPQLLHALFELADMWCPTTEAADYVTMLNELLETCKSLESRHGLFSKLIRKYQRRYGARDEHELPISGGYVYDYNAAAGRAVGPGGGGGPAAPAVPEPLDEADQALKAAAEDEEDAGHKAATNWWAKIMERNKKFMEAKAARLAAEAAAALAAGLKEPRHDPDKVHLSPIHEALHWTASGHTSPSGTESGALPPAATEFGASGIMEPLAFANLLPPAGVALPPELDRDAAGGSGLGGDEELERGGLRVQYMGKGVKGQIGAPPPGPPPPVVAHLRDALKAALVEVGASADDGEAAAVLTADGTIAYNQVGPHTMVELINVLVTDKKMSTKNIRMLMGSFHYGHPTGAPPGSGSAAGVGGSTGGLDAVGEEPPAVTAAALNAAAAAAAAAGRSRLAVSSTALVSGSGGAGAAGAAADGAAGALDGKLVADAAGGEAPSTPPRAATPPAPAPVYAARPRTPRLDPVTLAAIRAALQVC